MKYYFHEITNRSHSTVPYHASTEYTYKFVKKITEKGKYQEFL